MTKRLPAVVWCGCAAVAAVGLFACPGTQSGAELAALELMVSGVSIPPNATIPVATSALAIGEEGVCATLKIVDTGRAPLAVTAIELESEAVGVFRLAADPETLAPLPSAPFTLAPYNDDTADDADRARVF